jgi:multiple antibiotic resistance protein
MTIQDMVLFAVSLLAMFSPPAAIGSAAALLSGAPVKAQRRVAWLVARNYAIAMILSITLGHAALSFLGIEVAALTVTGAAALMHQGWPLMTRGGKAEEAPQRDPQAAETINWMSLTTVPLTFPLTIGGGTIAVVITASGRFPTGLDLAILSGISIGMAGIVAITFLLAGPFGSRMGAGAMDVLARISGIILLSLGVQLAVGGLRELFLKHHVI